MKEPHCSWLPLSLSARKDDNLQDPLARSAMRVSYEALPAALPVYRKPGSNQFHTFLDIPRPRELRLGRRDKSFKPRPIARHCQVALYTYDRAAALSGHHTYSSHRGHVSLDGPILGACQASHQTREIPASSDFFFTRNQDRDLGLGARSIPPSSFWSLSLCTGYLGK